MARIDKRRTKGSRSNARRVTSTPRRGSGGTAIEDTMFFPRLRRHTKWMFVLLALFFGVGFVAFGVGAGGTGIGDIFRNHQSGGGGPSVKSALTATQKRPNDPKAWLDLANVYRTSNETANAIAAQTRYTELAPKNSDGFRTLASDYFDQARQQATIAQNSRISSAFSGSVSPAGSGPTLNGKPLFTDPLAGVSPTQASSAYATAVQAQSAALQSAVSAYQKVAALSPNDPNVQAELGSNAVQAGNTSVAIQAFKRYLKLAPDSSDAPLIRRELKQLTKQQTSLPSVR
jgi:tetratricopeptide (TPR) repeat protein